MTGEEVGRLARRLAREQTARREAERIAEKTLRDLFLVNQDLDEKVRVRTAELDAARIESGRSDAARSEFLRMLSREIRTPLNGVLGMLELLTAESITDQQRLWTTSALRSASDLDALVGRLLLYVDLDRPNPLPPQQLSVKELLAHVESTWGTRAMHTGKLLVIDDQSDPAIPAFGYPTNLMALVDEIVENAVVHADPGRLAVAASSSADQTTICVVDSGPGLPDPARLLAVDDTTTSADSRGVGYALITKLARCTGATVTVNSAPGSPTSVIVALAQAAVFD